MKDSEIRTYKFPGGMNAESSGIVSELLIALNQNVIKGQKLAVFISGDYIMEMEAERGGIVIEIFVTKNQTIYQNDDIWKIENYTQHSV